MSRVAGPSTQTSVFLTQSAACADDMAANITVAAIAEMVDTHRTRGDSRRLHGDHCARASSAAHWLSQVSVKVTVVGMAKVLTP
jgi:hypothetical protein